jgi:hypothetical protein
MPKREESMTRILHVRVDDVEYTQPTFAFPAVTLKRRGWGGGVERELETMYLCTVYVADPDRRQEFEALALFEKNAFQCFLP